MEKICKKCSISKNVELFTPHKGYRDHRSSWCKACYKVYNDSRVEKARIKRQERRKDPVYKQAEANKTKEWRANNPIPYLLHNARARANKFGLNYNLTREDLEYNGTCPILEVPMIYGTAYAPSLDKIIPELGYIKGNVMIISMKANVMKHDASIQELQMFAKNISKYIK